MDQVCFQLTQASAGTVIAQWEIEGDSPWLSQSSTRTSSNALFDMTVAGGWVSNKPTLTTKENWDPTLALAVAHLVAYEFSPNGLKKDLNSNFPSNPSYGPPGEQLS